MFLRSKVLLNDFIRLSLPALGNDLSWSVAFSMYSVILGHLGTDAVAANSLVTVVRNIGSVFCFAIASAGTILLGQIMGQGEPGKIQTVRFQNASPDCDHRRYRWTDRSCSHALCAESSPP